MSLYILANSNKHANLNWSTKAVSEYLILKKYEDTNECSKLVEGITNALTPPVEK